LDNWQLTNWWLDDFLQQGNICDWWPDVDIAVAFIGLLTVYVANLLKIFFLLFISILILLSFSLH